MKHAFLIIAHNNWRQLKQLINVLIQIIMIFMFISIGKVKILINLILQM